MCRWDKKPYRLISRQTRLVPKLKCVRAQGAFSDCLTSVCLSCFAFSSFLITGPNLYSFLIQLKVEIRKVRGNILVLHNWTFCHVLGLNLLYFATHLKFFLSDSIPLWGDERVLSAAQMWHGHEPMRKRRKSASSTPISSRHNYVQYYESGWRDCLASV